MQTNNMTQLRSRREAANYLGVSPQTLAVWACTNRYHLPLIKIGRHVKYLQSDLDAFIARNTFGGEMMQ